MVVLVVVGTSFGEPWRGPARGGAVGGGVVGWVREGEEHWDGGRLHCKLAWVGGLFIITITTIIIAITILTIQLLYIQNF